MICANCKYRQSNGYCSVQGFVVTADDSCYEGIFKVSG